MREHVNIEDQVGGLIDHHDRQARRRSARRVPESEPVEPERYELTARAKPRIRAERASDAPAHRRVA